MFRNSMPTTLGLFFVACLCIFGAVRIFAGSTDTVKTADAAAVTKPGATMVPGQPAPDFKLQSQDGKDVKLSDYRGKWVVLYFYPKDFTHGCTIEAHNFQRDLAKYDSVNAVILGVSIDSAGLHKEFCAKEGLNFKLLADTAGTVSILYGSVHNWFGHKMSARNTFIVNPEGTLVRVFIGVKPATHSEEVLASLAELRKK